MKNKLCKILIIGMTLFFFKVEVEAKTGVCTATKLNVRSGAGTEFSGVGYILENTKVNIKGSKSDSTGKIWYKVSFTLDGEKKTGYAISDYIKVTKSRKKKKKSKSIAGTNTEKVADGKGYKAFVKAQGLRVRVKPGQTKKQLIKNGQSISLNNGDVVKVIGEKYNKKEKWYKIKADGFKGFVLSDYVKLDLKKEVPATVKKAVLRVKPKGNNGKAIKNSNVSIFYEITLNSVKYFKIRLNKTTGYVKSNEVKILFRKPEKAPEKIEENTPKNDTDTKNEETSSNADDDSITEGRSNGNGDVANDTEDDISSSEISDFNAKKGLMVSESVLYSEPSYNSENLKDDNVALRLKEGQEIFVRKKYDMGEKWYLITYVITNSKGEQIIGAGFIPEKYVKFP